MASVCAQGSVASGHARDRSHSIPVIRSPSGAATSQRTKPSVAVGMSPVYETRYPVQVFSHTAGQWVSADVAYLTGDEQSDVWVEFMIPNDDRKFGKTLHRHSSVLRMSPDFEKNLWKEDTVADPEPESRKIDPEGDARCILRQIAIRFPTLDNEWQLVEQALSQEQHAAWQQSRSCGLEYYRNNCFYTRQSLTRPCEIRYCGLVRQDVLVKVYILDATNHEAHDWESYRLHDYFHAEEKQESVFVRRDGHQPYFLGLMLFKGLTDWLKGIDEEKRIECVRRSHPEGWEGRGEVGAEHEAGQSDFILSRATADLEENNERLKILTSRQRRLMDDIMGPHGFGPITFCTDRSLGFGQHFVCMPQHPPLYLGKHGFGQPVKNGVWFEHFADAAKQTRHGVLIVNFTVQYLKSMACRKEFGRLPQERLFIFIKERKKIVSWSQLKQDSELLLEALGIGANIQYSRWERTKDFFKELAGVNTDVYRAERVLECLAIDSITATDPHSFVLFCDLIYHLHKYAYGERHCYTGFALNCLASSHGAIGNFETMREMQQNALEIHEAREWEGSDQAYTSGLMHHLYYLGKAHAYLGDYQRVREVMLRASQMPCLSWKEYYRGRILKLLSDAYGFLGDLQRKEDVMREAVKLLEMHYEDCKDCGAEAMTDNEKGQLTAHLCTVLVLLGNAHGELGRPAQRLELLSEALEITERHCGKDHVRVAFVLGNIVQASTDVEQVEPHVARMLSIYRNHYGEDHVVTERVQRALEGKRDKLWLDEEDLITPGWWLTNFDHSVIV